MREPRDPLLKVVLYCVKRGAHSLKLCYGVCVKTQNYRRRTGIPQTIELQRVHRCEWMCEQSVHMPPCLRTSNSSCQRLSNDPSAGSPPETLLRLLLPLNNQA